MNRGKKHWIAKKLRAQHKAGDKNFRQADLSGQSFRGEDLSGADFSGADIRATDFTQAKLVGANFRNAQIGGTRWSACLTIVCCIVLATVSTNAFLNADADYLLRNIIGIPTGFLWGCIALEVAVYFCPHHFLYPEVSSKQTISSKCNGDLSHPRCQHQYLSNSISLDSCGGADSSDGRCSLLRDLVGGTNDEALSKTWH